MRDIPIPEDKFKHFLSEKGTVEIIEVIGTHGSRWKELEETIELSTATLQKRLERGRELDLFEVESRDDDGGIEMYYMLTWKYGEPIFHEMNTISMITTIRELRDCREEFAAKQESLNEFVDGRMKDSVQARLYNKKAEHRLGGPRPEEDEDEGKESEE